MHQPYYRFIFTCLMMILGTANSYAASYWSQLYQNNFNHFQDASGNALQNWIIEKDDIYLAGSFFGYTFNTFLAIKPGQKNVLFRYDQSFQSKWSNLAIHQGTTHLGNQWPTQADDIYVVGEFSSFSGEQILVANPDGRYQTLRVTLSSNPAWGSAWQSLQYATNGNIDHGDKLIAGNFDGHGKDEVMLIKASGEYHMMRFNQSTSNWDIISSDTTGFIHWWKIRADDQYVVGDYNGDGKDEIIAINPNGWHHTMSFNNNSWSYLTGGSNGLLGQWKVDWPDTDYIAGDFNADGKDEILAVNGYILRSHTVQMTNNGPHFFWQTLKHNGTSATMDTYVNIDRYNAYMRNKYSPNGVFVLNTNGTVSLVKY